MIPPANILRIEATLQRQKKLAVSKRPIRHPIDFRGKAVWLFALAIATSPSWIRSSSLHHGGRRL